MSEQAPHPQPNGVTIAQQEAMQEFALGNDTAKAHTEALKEYRKRDIAAYTDHIASLADQEDEGNSDTNGLYQNLLDKEHRIADRQEYIDDKKAQAVALGEAALAFSAGIATLAAEAVDKKVLEYRYNRAQKKHLKETARKERATAKQQRREARSEKLEKLNERTLGRIRKLGARATQVAGNIYQVGLEVTDPTKAAERKQAMAERQEREKREALESALGRYDIAAQTDKVTQLMKDPATRPLEIIDGGFMSDVFTNEDEPNKSFAVVYTADSGGQLAPRLIERDGTKGWKIETDLDAKNRHDKTDVTDTSILDAAYDRLNYAGQYGETVLTHTEMADVLNLTSLHNNEETYTVSTYKKNRERLIRKIKAAKSEQDPLKKKRLEREVVKYREYLKRQLARDKASKTPQNKVA